MSDVRNTDSYETDNVMIVGAATCITHVCIVLFYFWLAGAVNSHHSFAGFGKFDLVMASLWSLGASTIVATTAALLKRLLPFFPPSWLAIPVGSTFVFIFSMAVVGYWIAVSNYPSDNPFRSVPPPLNGVLSSAFWIATSLSGLTTGVVFTAYAWWLGREKETRLHIDL